MNQNEIITAVVALMVCGLLAGVTAIPLIAGISQETITEEYNDESNAGWLRMAYDNKPFDVEITADGDNITAGGQTGLNDDMILYADASACVMCVNGAFVIVNGYTATPEVINATSVAITNADGSLTVEADGDTVITATSPAWAYYPDATGKYAYFGADVDGVKIKASDNHAYAGTFAGVWAYNNVVVAPNNAGDLGLSLNAVVEDDIITSVTWAVQEVADTLGAIDFDPSTITLQPLDPSIIDDPITSRGVGLMTADPTTGTRIGDLYYTFSGSNATVIGYASTIDWSSFTTIPDTVVDNGTTYTVTSIDNYAFQSCTNLALTSLPSGLTSIGINAFNGCTRLALTSLPSGVISIGNNAFNGCTRLALTSLPSSMTYINTSAFSGCTNLALTSLPDGVTGISTGAFQNCTNLALTSLPSGLTSIGNNAFKGCTNLALTSLPSGLTSIGNNAFQSCTNLALTSLPSGLTSIGLSTFQNCTNLALTSLPDGVTSIGYSAFQSCTNLALTSLPDGVTSIGGNAFNGCTRLALTSLPESVTDIGSYAFRGCTNLISLIVQSTPTLASDSFYNCTNLNQILNLGGLDIVAGSSDNGYIGKYAEEVRSDVPALGYIAPLSTTTVVTKDGAVYDLVALLPLIMVLGVVMMGVYAVGTRYA